MMQLIREHVRRSESFAFETTFADRGYARAIPNWRASGYYVSIWFLSLPSVDVAIARVAERVRQGGHFVAEAVVRRRFLTGRENFENLYKPIVDAWALYDNSGDHPILLDWGEHG
jgi:predicted ABC-type ATPase